tara:strand:+ start:445 stop:987 length:543 start_codon:yes stop_codon:yes gene_type:complete
VYDCILAGETFPDEYRDCIDLSKVGVAGFSYGATTAALSAATHPDRYKAAVLLDGWFSMDLASIDNCAVKEVVDFPIQAFEKGIHCPALFLGSEEFDHYTHMRQATDRLQESCTKETKRVVVPGTVHWSFIDVALWTYGLAPRFYNFLRRKLNVYSEVDPAENLEAVIQTSRDFLKEYLI